MIAPSIIQLPPTLMYPAQSIILEPEPVCLFADRTCFTVKVDFNPITIEVFRHVASFAV